MTVRIVQLFAVFLQTLLHAGVSTTVLQGFSELMYVVLTEIKASEIDKSV